ncbi:endoglucanase [Saonia flava]|uniref:Endoglucanase n=1 Tax=Saonia flava TaxID=523696 RepID=A0A846R017_9FLAO|nr:glycoside hydrolase family 5 protein [Saonia flava]NJB72282.1 endoglucanase [Saonia flava]
MKKSIPVLLMLVLFLGYSACSSSSDDDSGQEQEQELSEEHSSENEEEEEEENGTTVFSSAVEQYGQLSVDGSNIVDKDGNPVQLRGMSFFWSQWIGKYYTPEVVKWLKDDWQCNIVRAALAVEEGGNGYIANPEVEKQKIFTVIDAAIEEGIYVLVDWHSHHAEDYVTEAKAFFAEVAEKYGHHPNIIYEPYNEPLDVSWSATLKPYHEEVIAAIREHDPDNIVVCGTRTWSQRVDEVIGNKIDDANVAYTLHYYAATHKQELRDIAQLALNNDIPLFVTEYGVTQATGDESIDEAEANVWWDFLDQHKISWCNWSIADKEELAAALKPNASTLGGWSADDLTQSGTMVRAEIKKNNPEYTK